jgi:DNA repair protein RadC
VEGSSKKSGIKSWSAEDRPREKLIQKGRNVLSNAELLAILLGSGIRERSAVDVAKDLLQKFDNDLTKLGQLSVKQISSVKGIGEARAITITAALELGRRRKATEKQEKFQIKCSRDAYDYAYPFLVDLNHEEFYVLLLNRNNQVLRHQHISSGGVAGTVVDPKMIFRYALEENICCSIILCHNHPSGNLKPSQADIDLTRKVKEAGKFLEISVLDHLIFTNDSFYSFADEGMI